MSASETLRTYQAGDITLSVCEAGQGTPLLLVHGFPLSHAMWQPQIDALAATCRIIAPDLRGFGKSEVTFGTVSMEQFADDLAALLDAMQIAEPVIFCGLSMGGYIGWQFWRKHRRRVRALIQCDTRAVADTPEAAKGRLTMAERVLAEGAVVAADAMMPKLFAKTTHDEQPAMVAGIRQQMLETHPQGIAAAQRGMAARPDATSLLATIDVPTLVIVGTEDVISNVTEMRAIAGAIPGAQFLEVPQAGHMAPLENPAAVNPAIERFVRSIAPAS